MYINASPVNLSSSILVAKNSSVDDRKCAFYVVVVDIGGLKF